MEGTLGSIRNLAAYRKIASESPDPAPFLVATNYQPERTTIPDCGYFGDVLPLRTVFIDLYQKKVVPYLKSIPPFLIFLQNIFTEATYTGLLISMKHSKILKNSYF